ncbi:MAG: WecB/TagA/CpsF family glycosyltransferase [Candidatus Margulisbacteria bacterium]|nr:WecB/TagA/CpsF family glycosyltransferase [Candidatus Margulisiibacteriota bacterium]
METVSFAGVKVDNLSLLEAIQRVGKYLQESRPHLIVTPNPEIIVTAQKDHELREIINNADLRVPDGISMVVVSRILGRPLKERVSGIDLMLKIIEKYGDKFKIFLLGSAPGIADEAADKLVQKYPALKIVGTMHGFFGDDLEALQKIENCQPDILFVGLGAGRQEKWLNHHLKNLNLPVAMVIGGSLDVISDRKKRAPFWTQKMGVEWLYRLFTEPQRWKRQLALPKFLWLTFRQR